MNFIKKLLILVLVCVTFVTSGHYGPSNPNLDKTFKTLYEASPHIKELQFDGGAIYISYLLNSDFYIRDLWWSDLQTFLTSVKKAGIDVTIQKQYHPSSVKIWEDCYIIFHAPGLVFHMHEVPGLNGIVIPYDSGMNIDVPIA